MPGTSSRSESKELSSQSSESLKLVSKSMLRQGYFIGQKISHGALGSSVYLAEFIDHSSPSKNLRLACKVFDKRKLTPEYLEKFLPRQLDILMKIDNENLIKVHSIRQSGPRVFIFMDYAENDSLYDYIEQNGATPEQLAKMWFRQMIAGVQYLHSKNIAHRDLNCENILLAKNYQVKIADFGFTRFFVNNHGTKILSETYCGSLAYAAPEVFLAIPYNPELADIWSLGIILFIMLNGSMPFDDANLMKLVNDQTSRNWAFCRKVRDHVSPACESLTSLILEPDVKQRFTLDRILAHEWLAETASPRIWATDSAATKVVERGD